MPTSTRLRRCALVVSLAALALAIPGTGMRAQAPLPPDSLPQDRGAAGAWQKLLKLTTLASLMHTTAHPDDEQGGMLTHVSRGLGVRTTLLTLNRGESGDNAIGAELFDALGLVRTEELRVSDRFYGVDEQFFTTAVDYGYSKRLDEAIEKWGREHVLRDMVRVLRTERPWVVVSRWQGNARDGHGQHQAAGLLSQDAVKAAADPARFPEQMSEGLRPWQVLKLYMGGARENEPWTLRVDTGGYDPVLGDSYANLARLGLSFQRSQNSGRYVPSVGPAPQYFVRLSPQAPAAGKEKGFFDGIDTSWEGLYRALGKTPPPGADALLAGIAREVTAAREAFSMIDPARSAPALVRGLTALRAARGTLAGDADVVHVLALEEQQFIEALVSVLGLEVSAIAVPSGTPEPTGPFAAFAPAAVMGPIVSGQAFDVRVQTSVRGHVAVPVGIRRWSIDIVKPGSNVALAAYELEPGPMGVASTLAVKAPSDLTPTRSGFSRASLADSVYTSSIPGAALREPGAPVRVSLTLTVGQLEIAVSRPVQRRENQQPYGYAIRDLVVVPEYVVSVSPRQAMLPVGAPGRSLTVTVDVVNNQATAGKGVATLEAPSGWRIEPASTPFELSGNGARTQATFTVTPSGASAGRYPLTALVRANDKTFREGYDVLEHRDLVTRYHYRPSSVSVAAVDVKIAPDLSVGYVMGVGDELPAALSQLGARVQLLDAAALTSAPLDRFNAIVLGTRAYAVRADLRANNARLLEYAKNGGNLIVLYNTQELDPSRQSPFPAKLPANAEEVSEEDATVTILAPDHPLFTTPNRITAADFDGWVEQRGSKFWTEWDAAYTPLLECHDRGQAPQRGGWLHARYGKGHYSYVAYAFHRQLPFGVPGAYRLMANLLSLE
jgi:LmbE family N-acetylglucosaminyl deacetylase